MRAKSEETLIKVGLVGGIAAGAFLIWKYVFNGGQKPGAGCPAGTHYEDACASYQGLPKALCEIGRFTSGGMGLECIKDTVVPHTDLPKDTYGCLIDTQRWCSTDNECRDNARSCTPPVEILPSPGPCYEWSPTFHQWLYSPGLPGCEPYYEQPLAPEQKTLACNDGSYVLPSKGCPIVPKTCWDGTVIDLNSGKCPIKPDPITYLKVCDCGVNGKLTIDTRTGTCENACPPADFFVPVPVPGIECKAGRYNALSNRPGRLDGFGMSEAGCYAQGGDQWTKAGGRCTNALDRERQAYVDACGFL